MGGHTMREGLTVGRSLSAAAIVYLGGMGVNGVLLVFRAMPGGCSRGSVQPVRNQRSKRLLEQAQVDGAAGDRNGRRLPYLRRGHRVSQ